MEGRILNIQKVIEKLVSIVNEYEEVLSKERYEVTVDRIKAEIVDKWRCPEIVMVLFAKNQGKQV